MQQPLINFTFGVLKTVKAGVPLQQCLLRDGALGISGGGDWHYADASVRSDTSGIHVECAAGLATGCQLVVHAIHRSRHHTTAAGQP